MVPPNAYAADLHGGSVSGCSTRPSRSPIPRHKSKHPAPACQPTSQTDVIDAHNMAIIAHLWKMFGKIQAEPHYLLPGVTPLECLPPSYGVFSPPYSAKPIPQLISLSHFASYPAFSFNLSLFALHFLQAFMPLPFLSSKFVINLIRFNRAHLHPFARLRHTFFVRPTNFGSTNSIIPYFEPTFDCIVISTASIQLFSTAIDI